MQTKQDELFECLSGEFKIQLDAIFKEAGYKKREMRQKNTIGYIHKGIKTSGAWIQFCVEDGDDYVFSVDVGSVNRLKRGAIDFPSAKINQIGQKCFHMSDLCSVATVVNEIKSVLTPLLLREITEIKTFEYSVADVVAGAVSKVFDVGECVVSGESECLTRESWDLGAPSGEMMYVFELKLLSQGVSVWVKISPIWEISRLYVRWDSGSGLRESRLDLLLERHGESGVDYSDVINGGFCDEKKLEILLEKQIRIAIDCIEKRDLHGIKAGARGTRGARIEN